jgi:hypothetical protein
MSFLSSLMFSLQHNRRIGRTGSAWKWGWGMGCVGVCGKGERERGGLGVSGYVAQTMYTHVSKCKNNKTKGEKINIQNSG